MLWSYVRLLHKPQRAETERGSWMEREGGLLHHYKGDSHCTKSSSHYTCMRNHTTTTYKLSLATCVLLETMRPSLSSIFRTHTYTHTHRFQIHMHQLPVFVTISAVCPCLYVSFPTRDPQQTMTHPSGFHLRDQ